MSEKFKKEKQKKCIVLLVSGHSGDEHDSYRTTLEDYFKAEIKKHSKVKNNVILNFGEAHILPNREVMVNRKYYSFADVPAIVAASGGMGTYFSEVEGFGNNLLEMMALGLPVVLNRYNIYKTDLEPLGFDAAAVDNCKINDEVVEIGYKYLTDPELRRKTIQHNLEVLNTKLSHDLMASILSPLIQNLFKYR